MIGRNLGRGLCGLGMALAAQMAMAATVSFEYNQLITDTSVAPAGGDPWVTATFDDHGGTGLVTLTIDASAMTGAQENIQRVFFNLDDAFDPSALSFSYVGGSGDPAVAINTGSNCCMATNGGYFDIDLGFGNGFGFDAGETVSYDISLAGISAESFFGYSASGGSGGTYVSVIHVQGTGPLGADSAWIAGFNTLEPPSEVPVPAAVWLFGSGLIALGGLAGRRQA